MDIDTDYSRYSRTLCINYAKEKYGERAVAGIMTKGRLGAKSALTYAPKLLGLEKHEDKTYYTGLGSKIRSLIDDNDVNPAIEKYEERIREEFADNEDALTILEYAKMLEGRINSYGQHAAGLICIQNDEIENYIPLMAVKDNEGNDSFVIQADMVEAEGQLGFIKFDFLGLKNLNIITKAMQLIQKNYGITYDPYKIPFEEEVFRKIFATGDTNFVFQFESEGMKGMLRELQPTCFGDIVLAVSVYRPGPMAFIDQIIAAKRGVEESEITRRIPMLKEVYAETYGYPVYQEEVMRTFTVCANFSAGKADEVRRHMSKKHEKELAAIRPEFIAGCKNNNISEEDANWLFDKLEPFAKYGFNKSHAAAYSLVSYITAWNKYHYFKEYICGAMTEQMSKTTQFMEDCKARNIVTFRPDINESEEDYSIHNDGIIIGLSAIKGMKDDAVKIVEERNKNGLYESLDDLIERAPIRSNNLKALILAGACDTFVNDRESAAKYAENYKEIFSKKKEYEEKVSVLKDNIKAETNESEISKLERSLKTAQKNVEKLEKEIKYMPKPSKVMMSTTKRLALESEYLDMWVTGNPLEDYNVTGYKKIYQLEHKEVATVAGVINNFKRITTKKGQEMGLGSLMDADGNSLKIVCFPQSYSTNKAFLEDGKIVSIKGEVKVSEDEIELFVNEVNVLSAVTDSIIVSVKNIEEYKTLVEPILLQNMDPGGVSISINNLQMQELREVAFKVSKGCVDFLGALNIDCA